MKKKFGLSKLFIHLTLILFSLFCFLPIAIVISASLSKEIELIRNGYNIFPRGFSLAAYETIFKSGRDIFDAYMTTIIITVVGTFVSMVFTSMTAYTLSRTDFRYRDKISFFIYFTMLFGGGMIPSYLLITQYLKLGNTIWVLFVPNLILPWYIFMMRRFLTDVPISLIESAKLDGGSEILIFYKIVVPISKPAFAAISVLIALMYWNSWMPSLLYIDSKNLYTLQYLLYNIMANIQELQKSEASTLVGATEMPQLTLRMAMCICVAGPMLFVFPFFQKYFVRGLTVGAVKG